MNSRYRDEMPTSKPAASHPAMSTQTQPPSDFIQSASSVLAMKRLSTGHRNSCPGPVFFTWPE